MGKRSSNITTEQIAKYLAGQCTTEEVALVEDWKSENEASFLQFKTIWEDTGSLKGELKDLQFDTTSAWNKVKKKIKKKNTPSITLWPYLRIAAVLVVGVGLGLWAGGSFKQQSGSASFAVSEKVGMVQLPDGSSITLNTNSTLTQSKDFSLTNRQVELRGEAFFEIEADPENPFTISVSAATIQVLGTSFNVKVTENSSVQVEVTSGVVQMAIADQMIELQASEFGLFDIQSGNLSKGIASTTGLTTFWKDRKLSFDGESLPEIISTLELAYGTTIKLEGDQLNQCQLHVTFDHSTVEEVMEIIALTLELQVAKKEDHYLISGKGCKN